MFGSVKAERNQELHAVVEYTYKAWDLNTLNYFRSSGPVNVCGDVPPL